MSQKKKVVVTTREKKIPSSPPKVNNVGSESTKMLFGKENYKWMLIGVACILLGMFLMAGGHQAPDVWNESEIFSFRRIVLAPFVILVGLGIQFFAIFKKSNA